MDRRTYLDSCGVVARYHKDIKRIAELREDIFNRYKGALAGMPIGSGSSDGTGDPERRALELEKLENSNLNLRILCCDFAFADLAYVLTCRGWNDADIKNITKAIIANCDNRRDYSFYGLQHKFKIPCVQKTFGRYKTMVLENVARKMQF